MEIIQYLKRNKTRLCRYSFYLYKKKTMKQAKNSEPNNIKKPEPKANELPQKTDVDEHARREEEYEKFHEKTGVERVLSVIKTEYDTGQD